MTYLDHDHRERENIRRFGICSLLGQDLWRSPSRGMTLIIQDKSCGIRILSDGSQTKVRDPRTTGSVHKDIWLLTCQFSGTTGFRKITYTT